MVNIRIFGYTTTLGRYNTMDAIILSGTQFIEDRFDCYERFTRYLVDVLHIHPGPVSTLDNIQTLEDSYQARHRDQRHIYSTILEKHSKSVSQYTTPLNVIRSVTTTDKLPVTTRSLMILFYTLLSLLQLKNK